MRSNDGPLPLDGRTNAPDLERCREADFSAGVSTEVELDKSKDPSTVGALERVRFVGPSLEALALRLELGLVTASSCPVWVFRLLPD